MSWVQATDLETIKSLLEKAGIDFEEINDSGDDKIHIETSSGVYFTFSEDEDLEEVSNG